MIINETVIDPKRITHITADEWPQERGQPVVVVKAHLDGGDSIDLQVFVADGGRFITRQRALIHWEHVIFRDD